MSSRQEAIVAINTEMQKRPGNRMLEVVGQYIIDRTNDPTVIAAIDAGKTLAGAVEAITKVAKAAAVSGVAMMTDVDVFNAVDKYLGVKADDAVREATRQAADGGPVSKPQGAVRVEQGGGNVVQVDFENFL